MLPEHVQKGIPGHGLQLPVKGQLHHPVHAADFLQQPLPVLGCVDEPRGDAQHQGIRVAQEGHGSRLQRGLRQLPALPQQCPVAPVDPVKEAQGVNVFLHPCETSKKLLIVDITPFSTLASMRNSPLRL